MRLLISFIVALIVLSFQAQAQIIVQPPPQIPLITVNGEAEIKVAPDQVEFTLEVEKTDKDLTTARNLNDRSVKQILEVARSYNIDLKDIQTSDISVEQKFTDDSDTDSRPRRKREFIGFSYSKTIIITLKDISRFDSLLADILKSGVTRVRDVEFRTSQLRRNKDQARALAIKAAQEKATALAKEIGQTIGKAYSIREDGAGNDYTAVSNASATVNVTASSNESIATISPGLITTKAQVTVSFILN
ncbi:MAG: SIMPL domain-containing protein [Pyrinomonadaceae bacterium]